MIRLAYSIIRNGRIVKSLDSASYPTIAVLHGMFGSSLNWKSFALKLSSRINEQVVIIDAPNHGESQYSLDMGFQKMALAHRDLLTNELSLKEFSLIGHSMGGKTAMILALQWPELIRNLVAVDIAPIPGPVQGQFRDYDERLAAFNSLRLLDLEKFRGSDSISAVRRTVDTQLAKTVNNNQVRSFFLANIVQDESGNFKWKFNLNAVLSNLPHLLDFPVCPSRRCFKRSLFIGGSDSPYMTTKKASFSIAEKFPNASVEVVDRAGHWVHYDQPAKFLELVVNFFRTKGEKRTVFFLNHQH